MYVSSLDEDAVLLFHGLAVHYSEWIHAIELSLNRLLMITT
jgi:hypothetical protein